MTHAPALAELQQNLQALQRQLEEDAVAAIAAGLALCQNFETQKHRYLPATWLQSTPPSTGHSENHSEIGMGREEETRMKNAAEKGKVTDNLPPAPVSTAPVSTAPEEQMLSHYVELTKHMRLLAADFSMFRAARNPSTQKSRQQQIHHRLARLLAYCQALGQALQRGA